MKHIANAASTEETDIAEHVQKLKRWWKNASPVARKIFLQTIGFGESEAATLAKANL